MEAHALKWIIGETSDVTVYQAHTEEHVRKVGILWSLESSFYCASCALYKSLLSIIIIIIIIIFILHHN